MYCIVDSSSALSQQSHDLTAKQWKLQEAQLAFEMKMTGSLVAAVAAVF
jgi:hypothetical protein